MKTVVTMIVALGLAVGCAAPTFAAEAPKDKASCEKAKMHWDDATKTCSKSKM
jgi:ABC-type proline/glycine betaine transport system substrate-binding protein